MIIVCDDIQIDGTGSITNRGNPPHRSLDVLEKLEERHWGHIRFNLCVIFVILSMITFTNHSLTYQARAVDELWLIEDIHRLGFVEETGVNDRYDIL